MIHSTMRNPFSYFILLLFLCSAHRIEADETPEFHVPGHESEMKFLGQLLISVINCLPTLVVEDASRDAWTFQMEGETVAYVRQESGEWLFVRKGKPPNELSEIESSDTEVVLQNVKTKLFIKLTNDQAFWRQPKQENWTTYHKGSFSKPPQELLDQISTSSKKMTPETAKAETSSKPNEVAKGDAQPHDYRVRVGYFVPSDRQPVANWEQKYRVVIHFVDSMYRNDLKLKGLDTPGLQWEMDGDQVKVHLIRGKEKADYYADHPTYNDNKQFSLISKEVQAHFGTTSKSLGLVLSETYNDRPSDVLWKGTFALGAYRSADGGLGMFSAHILRDEFCALTAKDQVPKFFDQTPVPGRRAMGHGMNSARCEFTEDGFGAVIHELGHALGLPHDFRDPDRFIMSNGFRQIRRNLSPNTPRSKMVTFSDVSTHLLMSSRFLNPKIDRTDNTPPKAELEIIGVSAQTGLATVRVKASDSNNLRVIALFDHHADSVITGGSISGKEYERTETVRAKLEKGSVQITLITVDDGGNQTRVKQESALSK